MVVERDRGEDNDGNDNFDNDNIGKAEAVAKTMTMSDAHVRGGTIETTIKK